MRESRLTGAILTLVLMIGMLSAAVLSVRASPGNPDGMPGSRDNPILISSEAELRAYADEVNNNPVDFSSPPDYQYIKLTRDIKLTDQWTPIGKVEGRGGLFREYAFFGCFDGDGYTISGVKIGKKDNPSTLERIGFFGSTHGDIVNLSIEVEIYSRCPEDQWQSVGGLASGCGGTIYNCAVTGSIYAAESAPYSSPIIGGITGECGGSIINSNSSVELTAVDATVGGIAGSLRNNKLEEVDDKLYIVPGQAAIDSCAFDGSITSHGEMGERSVIGGIAGKISSGAQVSGCLSIGDIVGVGTSGGLIGNCAECLIRDSFATGSVSGKTAGGLIGSILHGYLGEYELTMLDSYTESSVENCYSAGDISGDMAGGLIADIDWAEYEPLIIRDCHASGSVSGKGESHTVSGGLIGSANILNGAIENCYATGDVSGYNSGGFTASLTSYRQYYEDGVIGDGEPVHGTLNVSRCFASGYVESAQDAGGFAAHCGVNATDCAALGDVSAAHISYGFTNASEDSRVERCLAAGDVVMTDNARAAYAFGDGLGFVNCYASGDASGPGAAFAFRSGRNCYFSGSLAGAQGNAVYNYTDTVNSYGDMTVFPKGYTDTPHGKTTTEMHSHAFVELLNDGQSDSPWIYKQGSYPELASLQFHSVTVVDPANGNLTTSTDVAIEGNVIVASIEPDDGYELKMLYCDGTPIDGASFTMPGGDVTISAGFEPIPGFKEETRPIEDAGIEQSTSSAADEAHITVGDIGEAPWEHLLTSLFIICGTAFLFLAIVPATFLISRKRKMAKPRASVNKSPRSK